MSTPLERDIREVALKMAIQSFDASQTPATDHIIVSRASAFEKFINEGKSE